MKGTNNPATAQAGPQNETSVIRGPWPKPKGGNHRNPPFRLADLPANAEPLRKPRERVVLHHADLLLVALLRQMDATVFAGAMDTLREHYRSGDPELQQAAQWAVNLACSSDGKL